MDIETFGGLTTEQGHTYFYGPSGYGAERNALVILSNAQGQTLLDAYHREQPLSSTVDRERYGNFADRDKATQAELVSHIFAGSLQPFAVEIFHISDCGIGYMRHGFRALTNAMVTMGLPLIPVEVAKDELSALERLVGKPQLSLDVELFLQQRGGEFNAIQRGFTPAQYSYQKHFPRSGESHGEVRRATEVALFLLEHESENNERLPDVMRHYGLRGTSVECALADTAEHRKIHDRDSQQLYAADLLGTLYAADRQGIAIDYDKAQALHRWDHDGLKAWSQETLAQPGRPSLVIALAATLLHQQGFIAGLPGNTVYTESTRHTLQAGIDKFKHGRRNSIAPSPV